MVHASKGRAQPVACGTAESADQLREILEGVAPDAIPSHVYDRMRAAFDIKPTALVRLRDAVKMMRFADVSPTPDTFVKMVDWYLADLPVGTRPRPAASTPAGDELIYYLRIGTLIKIGYTANLAQRLSAYPPHRILLATENGGRVAEKLRHQQFERHLAYGAEWFHPTAELIEHINALRPEPLTAEQLVA